MQVKVNTVKDLKHQMLISIPISVIEQQITERLKRLSIKAKIAGFRPGKAPLSVIAANYGQGIRHEVIEEVVNQSFEKALTEQKLHIVGVPEFTLNENTSKDTFSFLATFEVYPKIVMGDLSTKTIYKPVTKVLDKDIDKTVMMLRKQYTLFKDVNRSARNEDRVTIDFKGTINQEPFDGSEATDFSLVLGQGYLLPAFEKQIIGIKKSETATLKVPFPKNYHAQAIAGKTAEFAITVKKVEQAEIPELNEQFIKKIGIEDGDVNKLLKEVRCNIEKEIERRLYFKTRENVINMLLEEVSVQLPLYFVEQEIHKLAQEAEKKLAKQYSKERVKLSHEIFKKNAERNVALNILFGEIIKSNQLTAKTDDIKSTVMNIAEGYEDPKEVVDWYYADKNRLAGAMSLVLEEEAVKWVLGQVKVVEQTVDFDEIMGIKGSSKPQKMIHSKIAVKKPKVFNAAKIVENKPRIKML